MVLLAIDDETLGRRDREDPADIHRTLIQQTKLDTKVRKMVLLQLLLINNYSI